MAIEGTNYDDRLIGTVSNDVIYGLEGNDTLVGNAGNDILDGGPGKDWADYSNATYAVRVDLSLTVGQYTGDSTGIDTLISIESLSGSAFNDTLTGDVNANNLYGHAGNDSLMGGEGNDLLNGGEGNDVLNGGGGSDTMYGWHGNDTYLVDNVQDVVQEYYPETEAGFVIGTGGIDLVRSSITYTLPTAGSIPVLNGDKASTAIENLFLLGTAAINGTGNEFANVMTGNNAANTLIGLQGNDTLNGSGGDDKLYGMEGDDTLNGGNDNDYLSGYHGADILVGGAGDDTLDGGDDNDTLNGGMGRDWLSGGGSADQFVFNSMAEAGNGISCDTITDFFAGFEKINLSKIDGNTLVAGIQKFTFIGASQFSGVASQLNYIGGIVSGDVNGDRIADFQIKLQIQNAIPLTAGDFIFAA